MPCSWPRRAWQSSMIAPMYSEGQDRGPTTGSNTLSILPVGYSLGLVTSPVPSSMSTR